MWGFFCIGIFVLFSLSQLQELYNASQVGENMLKVMEMQSIGPSATADTGQPPAQANAYEIPPWRWFKNRTVLICPRAFSSIADSLANPWALGTCHRATCLHFQMMAELGCTESWNRVAEPSPEVLKEPTKSFFTTFIGVFCSKTQSLPRADAHTEHAARYGVLQRCSSTQCPPPSLQGVV